MKDSIYTRSIPDQLRKTTPTPPQRARTLLQAEPYNLKKLQSTQRHTQVQSPHTQQHPNRPNAPPWARARASDSAKTKRRGGTRERQNEKDRNEQANHLLHSSIHATRYSSTPLHACSHSHYTNPPPVFASAELPFPLTGHMAHTKNARPLADILPALAAPQV